MFGLATVLVFCIAVTGWITGVAGQESEETLHRLWTDLLKDYDKEVRPELNATVKHTTVTLYFHVRHLVDIDEEKGFIEINAYLILLWKDPRLSWNSEDYGDIKFVSASDRDLWTPDITVFTSHSIDIHKYPYTNMRLYSTGSVIWASIVTLTNHCPFDLKDYPYDQQKCKVSIGSRSHHGEEIDLRSEVEKYFSHHLNQTNIGWNVSEMPATRVVRHHKKVKESYPQLDITIVLHREFPASLRVAWGPSLTSLLLTLAMFWAPSDCDKKLLIGSLAFLVLVILAVYVATCSPSALGGWRAVRPLHNTIFTIISAILLEALVINLARKSGPTRPPRFLVQPLYGVGGRILGLCFARPPTKVGDKVQLREDTDETLTPEDELKPEEEWKLLGTAIDRLLFVVYVIVLGVAHKGS